MSQIFTATLDPKPDPQIKGHTVNKAELIEAIFEATSFPRNQIDQVLTSACKNICEAATASEEAKLVGFGTFDVLTRQARGGRNPQTGKPMTIPAQKVPRFRPGKEFKDLLRDLD